MLNNLLSIILLGVVTLGAAALNEYPVATPAGGRFDVHGWLILPMDQEKPVVTSHNSNVTEYAISAWFSHHVPELWEDSPHNFQVILKGKLFPMFCVQGEVFPLELPYPPVDNTLVHEYSFTPPSPFSLNDLLNGDLKQLRGVFYNGSFDTPYERQASSLALLHIEDLTTAVYLDEFETESFAKLRYLSYPRGGTSSNHYYLAHEIHAQPDFDHVVHGVVSQCFYENGEEAAAPDDYAAPGSNECVIYLISAYLIYPRDILGIRRF